MIDWVDRRHIKKVTLGPRAKVGFAWVFGKIVVFGTAQDVRSLAAGKRSRLKMGAFIGKVKGVIPVDPYRVLYTYHKSSEAYKQRQAVRVSRRKLGVTRLEARSLQALSRWQK